MSDLVGQPDARVFRGQDFCKAACAVDAVGRELGDINLAGPVVAMLDQKPASISKAARAHQHPSALELGAVERELQFALFQSAIDGEVGFIITVESIEYDKVDPSVFELPASIKALIK